ncbi:DSBA oxidoreductase, partial [Pseudomonas syringae pv. tagetis]
MKRPTRRQILYCIGAAALVISPFLLTELQSNLGVTGGPVAPAAVQKRQSGGWVYGSREARFTIV